MSLLLDALRRAEEAKKAAREAAGKTADDAAPAMPDDALSLTPLEPAAQDDADPPLMTRENLPNISQAVVTLDDDPAPPAGAAPDASAQRTAPHRAQARETESAADLTAQRQAARQLFETGAPAYDPRRPFYFVLGALALTAIGIVGWFWYQLQPPAGATAPAAVRSAPVSPATATAPVQTPAAPDAGTAGETNAANATTAASAGAAVPMAPHAAETPPTAAATNAALPQRAEAPAPAAAPRARAPRSGPTPVLTHAPPPGPSPVELGYAAFERGDIATARTQYQTALAQDPLNRDALLGLAAIDVRTQHYASAEARYLKLLERDPRDAYAHAGLIGLRGRGDPLATESRLKNLLAQQPDSNVLNFALGNQYANEGRWAEAQQAYFHAWAADPTNADYAFNLAVSLDHLRQPRLAADYYRKAVALAGARPVAFDPAQAAARLRQLAP